jgi:hypothetical protein
MPAQYAEYANTGGNKTAGFGQIKPLMQNKLANGE